MKLKVIEWRDAFAPALNGWMTTDEVNEFIKDKDFIVTSVGFVIHEDKDMVTLVSQTSKQDNYSHLQRIPKGCIVRSKTIKV